MSGRRAFWADLSRPDFAALDKSRAIAVLPVGAIEQHGPHLPVSVDADLATSVAARALPLVAADLTVLILPPIAYGKSDEHQAIAGTLSLSAATAMALWREIGESVARAGISRFVLFNGHGGNLSAMDIVARDLRVSHRMVTACCSWFQFNEAEGAVDPREHAYGLHAGEVETSAMLALKPHLVEMARAGEFACAAEGWAASYRFLGLGPGKARPGWVIGDLNADGACGNAAAASAEKGEAFLSAAARNFASFLSEFDAFAATLSRGGEAR